DVAVVRVAHRDERDAALAPAGASSPTSACTAKSLVDALGATPESFVDWSPLFARADEIEQLRLETIPAGPIVDLARKASGWRERAPEARDLDQDESDSANSLAL